MGKFNWIDALRYVLAFLTSFLLSTVIIRKGIPKLRPEGPEPKEKTQTELGEIRPGSAYNLPLFDLRATGFWIGFCETLITFALVSRGEFGALAIIIGAKEFVRKKKLERIQRITYWVRLSI